mmetsp:Transcript_45506/g.145095  ORF Transcript_45506/g.145095 Transcript_45506/m.145095 type:complete len:204 (-) Transcript_45506:528-1139(-)
MSESFTYMSLFRNVRSRRTMSSRVCSSKASEVLRRLRVPSLPLPPLRAEALLAVPQAMSTLSSPPLQAALPPCPGPSQTAHSPLQLPSRSLLSPWEWALTSSSSEVESGLSCALAAGPGARSWRSQAPLAQRARRCRTSASETTGSSSLLSSASTKDTGSCSHCPSSPSVTREKWRRLRRASSRLCRSSWLKCLLESVKVRKW